MIITRTPYRLSFFGGGTDHNSWLKTNPGTIVSTTFSKYCYISLRSLPPFFHHKNRIVYSKIELVNSIDDIEHPAVRGCLQFMKASDRVEIHHDGDLPARSGLGSSSSFTVGLLNAINAWNGKMIDKKQLADDAITVEQDILQENVGIQDQIISSYGGLNIIEMRSKEDYSVAPLILPADYQDELQKHVLLAFTGLTRFSSTNSGVQIKKIENGEIVGKMSEIHSIAKAGLSLFQENADMSEIGKYIDYSWKIKKSLTETISSPKIDDAYEVAMKNGAFGGKIMGAGGGGFMMFLAPPEKHIAIKDALKDIAVWVPFKIEKEGSKVMYLSEDGV